MSTNISKQKREQLVEKIKAIKTFISTAPQDENTAQLLTYIAEIEKDNIKYRLNSGRKLAIAKGVKMGRKVGSIKSKEQKQEEYAKVIRSLKQGKSVRDTAAICGVSVSTVQRVKKDFSL